MSFKLAVEKAKLLTDLVSIIAVLADECTMQLTEESVSVKLMDPSRVAMISLEAPKTYFKEYVCAAPKKVCFNTAELLKLLKRAEASDTAALEPVGDELQLTFTGNRDRTFTLPTLEASEEDVPVPTICFNVSAKLTAKGLQQSLEDSGICSDHVTVSALDSESLRFDAVGDLLKAHITLNKGCDNLLVLETKLPAKSCYSLSYLTEITKAGAALSGIVNLEYSSDMPVKLDFLAQDLKINFFLAPRIETE